LPETLNRPVRGAEFVEQHAQDVAVTKSIGQAILIEKNAEIENAARYLVDIGNLLQLQKTELRVLSRHVNIINEYLICAAAQSTD
jgi:hypothetical protein